MLSALYAIVRASVCPPVYPSHGWISWKRITVQFHHTVAPSL